MIGLCWAQHVVDGRVKSNMQCLKKYLIFTSLIIGMTLHVSFVFAESLKLVTNWGTASYSVSRTLDFVENFNSSIAAQKVGLEIVFVGGPEVTPATQQLMALTNGMFDLLFGSAGYYVGTVPEAYAIYGSSITPMTARQTGATKLLDGIYIKKANAHVLGWVAAGVGYHIWLREEPRLNEAGLPNLDGLKMRSSGFYKSWLASYGATNVMVPAPDIYTSLERHMVDGAAWPGLGITDYGFEKFLGYRIDPPVWQFDNLLWINNDKWNGLNEEQRKVLTESVVAFEEIAYHYYKNLATEERLKVEASGVNSFRMSSEAERLYVDSAQDLQWEQVKKLAPENYKALRETMKTSN